MSLYAMFRMDFFIKIAKMNICNFTKISQIACLKNCTAYYERKKGRLNK